MELQSASRTAFIDSDNLQDLNRLFDYVGLETETFVVLCSRDILKRPWCVGEIVTANNHYVESVKVVFADFTNPTQDFINHFKSIVPGLSDLAEQNIDLATIQNALSWFVSCPELCFPDLVTQSNVQQLVKSLVRRNFVGTEGLQVQADAFQEDAQMVIIPNHQDMESCACALILVKLLLPHMAHQPHWTPHVLPPDQELPTSASMLLILCTAEALQRPFLLRVVQKAAMQKCQYVPILADEGFRFPSKGFLEDNYAMLASVSDDPEGLSQLVHDIFKSIAVVFQPQSYSSTELILMTKAQEVAKRMLHRAIFPVLSTTSSRSINVRIHTREWSISM